MAGGVELFGLAAAGAIVAAVLVRRRRRPAATALAVNEVTLGSLRAIVSGMEVAATTLVRGATVECLGNYRRDPGLLVVEVQTETEAEANRLIAEGGLMERLQALLQASRYPPAAIPQVGLTIRSRERLAREELALLEQEDIARWSGE